ncbi:MAG: hypothetical protein AAF533_02670 [Acidobacteriota bacterium]
MPQRAARSFLVLLLFASTANALDWTYQQVEAGRSLDGTADIAFGPDGQPAIAAGGSVLRYFRFDGDRWQEELVHGSSCGHSDPDLVFDPDGEPAIAWEDLGDGVVRLARRTTGTWTVVTVGEALGRSRPSLTFDAAGEPAIGFAVFDPECTPRVARPGASGWTSRDFEAEGGQCWPSLARTAEGAIAASWSSYAVWWTPDIDAAELEREPIASGGWPTATRLGRDHDGRLWTLFQSRTHYGQVSSLHRLQPDGWVLEQEVAYGLERPELVFLADGGVVVGQWGRGAWELEENAHFDGTRGSVEHAGGRLVALAADPVLPTVHGVFFDEAAATLHVRALSPDAGFELEHDEVLVGSEDHGHDVVLAMDSSERVALASQGGAIHLSHLDDGDGSWSTELVPDTDDSREGLNFVLTADGEPVLFHAAQGLAPDQRDLVLHHSVDGMPQVRRWRTAGRWSELRDEPATPGLVLDGLGHPVVKVRELWSLDPGGTWWSSQPVGATYWNAHLAMDDEGTLVACPQTAVLGVTFVPRRGLADAGWSYGWSVGFHGDRTWLARSNLGDAEVLVEDGRSWRSLPIPAAPPFDYLLPPTLALDSHGRPLVAFRSDGVAHVARWTVGGWVIQVLDDAPRSGVEFDDTLDLLVRDDEVFVAFHGRSPDCRRGPTVGRATLDADELWSLHRWSRDATPLLSSPTIGDDDEGADWPRPLGPFGATHELLDDAPLQLFTVLGPDDSDAPVLLRLGKTNGTLEIAIEPAE